MQSILISDDQLYPASEQQKELADFTGQCITTELLSSILGRLTRYYQARGYITTRPYLQDQDIADGSLEVSILIGRIGEVRLLSETLPARRIAGLFPQSGEILGLPRLEQAIATIERVPSASAEFSITPASEVGFSDVEVRITDAVGWMFEGGVLARSEQQADLSLAFRLDNPAQKNDLFWFRYNSGQVVTDVANNDSFEIEYSIPFWNSLLTVVARDSSYEQAVQGQLGSYQSEGESQSWTMDWILSPTSHSGDQWRAGLTLSAERTRAFFEDEPIDVSSYDSEEWGIVLQYESAVSPSSGYDIDYRYLLGGGDDGEAYFSSIEGFDSSADVEAARQLVTFNWRTASADRQRRFRLRTDLQVASELLRQNRKLSLGSFATVRGYQSALSGSQGWSMSGDYEWLWFTADNKNITVNVGLDYGEVDCEADNQDICGSIYGFGAGWLLTDANFTARLLVGLPLKSLPNSDADDQQMLLNLLWRI